MNNSGSKPAMNLQDSFLNHVRKENFTVIIENEGKQQLVYKHAISTISPAANITIMQPEKREQ